VADVVLVEVAHDGLLVPLVDVAQDDVLTNKGARMGMGLLPFRRAPFHCAWLPSCALFCRLLVKTTANNVESDDAIWPGMRRNDSLSRGDTCPWREVCMATLRGGGCEDGMLELGIDDRSVCISTEKPALRKASRP